MTGGWSYPTRIASVEVLSADGDNLNCSIPDLSLARNDHSQTGGLVCGGYTTELSCHLLSDQGWISYNDTLMHRRNGHTSWRSRTGVRMMGGHGSQGSTEILADDMQTSQDSFALQYDS